MTYRDRMENDYFDWMVNIECGRRYAKSISYRKLLAHLHRIDFRYSIPKDSNRSEDGIDLRRRFDRDFARIRSDAPCSVLEMMVALAIRCEEIMDDASLGNRTAQWFWGMIVNLGLGSMSDARYDRLLVDNAINRLLEREYEPNGKGGLFTVRRCDDDLRSVEIWCQMCYYLDTFV